MAGLRGERAPLERAEGAGPERHRGRTGAKQGLEPGIRGAVEAGREDRRPGRAMVAPGLPLALLRVRPSGLRGSPQDRRGQGQGDKLHGRVKAAHLHLQQHLHFGHHRNSPRPQAVEGGGGPALELVGQHRHLQPRAPAFPEAQGHPPAPDPPSQLQRLEDAGPDHHSRLADLLAQRNHALRGAGRRQEHPGG